MNAVRKLQALLRRHPMALVEAVLHRIPFRPIRAEYFERFELRGAFPPLATALEVRLADTRDVEPLVRCRGKSSNFESRFAAGEHCVVAIVDGSIAGYEWFSEKERHVEERFGYAFPIQDDALYAYDAYTSEAFRGRGVWRQVIAGAAGLLKARGRTRLLSHVDFGNDTSMTAHVKVGFRPVGRFVFLDVLGWKTLRQLSGVREGHADDRSARAPRPG
ncbi:MAG: hypothetical protein E6K71_02540 [Candidatus Eisenbacteria bacterium]|uniref:N-acetyltransferase domain-containing protein n=1 Tax=Eiseniibacteriota bacterium TaxID=2212470 RepID=A0A538SGE9_UNCEI|nr:MAG: hypothetical protein E6K71_02540 [Candidatus Eisenbacteria bacterium]